MSTRSAIAYPYGDGWRGRYVHSDGYPTSRGHDVWAFLQERPHAEYVALIDNHCGLSWMPAPGEDPHDTLRNKPLIGSGPGGAKYGNGACYASWGRSETDPPTGWLEEQGPCSEDTCDPLMIEWVYVAAESGALTVYSFGEDPKGAEYKGLGYRYAHHVVWTGRWDGPEPDWAAIEAAEEAVTA